MNAEAFRYKMFVHFYQVCSFSLDRGEEKRICDCI